MGTAFGSTVSGVPETILIEKQDTQLFIFEAPCFGLRSSIEFTGRYGPPPGVWVDPVPAALR